jgi:hypothetical protein
MPFRLGGMSEKSQKAVLVCEYFSLGRIEKQFSFYEFIIISIQIVQLLSFIFLSQPRYPVPFVKHHLFTVIWARN